MSNGLQILSLAEALAEHSSARQTLISRNVAHADTPGYRATDLSPFSQTWQAQDAVDDEGAFRPSATRPGHATLGGGIWGPEPEETEVLGASSPNGNSVSLEDQMVRAAEVKMQHDLALGVWKKSLDILRASMSAPR